MTDLIVDSEFKDLIPPLEEQERTQLEENILRDGIQDPLKTWNGILIDGHNRFAIAQKHGLTFETAAMNFADRNDAIIWIIKNQFGRRNLSAYDRSILALKLKPVIAAKAKEKQIESGGAVPQKSAKPPIETRQEIAKAAGVSHDTIAKVEKIEQQAAPEIKAALKSGDLSINAAYNKVQQTKRKEEIQKQAEAIEQRAIEQPNGLFDVIVIDPPWGYVKQAHHGSYDANGRRGTCPYPEMTQDELKTIEPRSAMWYFYRQVSLTTNISLL